MINNGLLTAIGIGSGMILMLALLWSLIWKGFALWIAAREEKKWRFIALLILNTVGIFEIVYIFVFSKWGKGYIAGLRNKNISKKTTKKCDCPNCEGCDCDCHKPIESN
jgi:hypothetical protein